MRRDDFICKQVKCRWFDDIIHQTRCELRCDTICGEYDFRECNGCNDCPHHDGVSMQCPYRTEQAVAQ